MGVVTVAERPAGVNNFFDDDPDTAACQAAAIVQFVMTSTEYHYI